MFLCPAGEGGGVKDPYWVHGGASLCWPAGCTSSSPSVRLPGTLTAAQAEALNQCSVKSPFSLTLVS